MYSKFMLLLAFVVVGTEYVQSDNPSDEKVLICGVCKNVASRIAYSIENIEQLGKKFKDYAVIIYENNSGDETPKLLNEWAKRNGRVYLISEVLPKNQISNLRMEKIARARNKVLQVASQSSYSDFKYLIMADLDFVYPFPIQEILASFASVADCDGLFANGIRSDLSYVDRYAFRDIDHPLGDELLGNPWWDELQKKPISIAETDELTPVFSAFGGLGIYKREAIIQCEYSGTVTKDLEEYYKYILGEVSSDNPQVKEYLTLLQSGGLSDSLSVPIHFCCERCCEHLTLHASMFCKGFNKFFINPKMKMRYVDSDHPPVW